MDYTEQPYPCEAMDTQEHCVVMWKLMALAKLKLRVSIFNLKQQAKVKQFKKSSDLYKVTLLKQIVSKYQLKKWPLQRTMNCSIDAVKSAAIGVRPPRELVRYTVCFILLVRVVVVVVVVLA